MQVQLTVTQSIFDQQKRNTLLLYYTIVISPLNHHVFGIQSLNIVPIFKSPLSFLLQSPSFFTHFDHALFSNLFFVYLHQVDQIKFLKKIFFDHSLFYHTHFYNAHFYHAHFYYHIFGLVIKKYFLKKNWNPLEDEGSESFTGSMMMSKMECRVRNLVSLTNYG